MFWRKLSPPVATLLILLLVAAGCSGSKGLEVSALSALGVDEADRPVGATDTFDPGTLEIFVVAEVKGAPAGTSLEAVWIWEEENYQIDTYTLELPQGSSRPYFFFTRPEKGWPLGYYRVELRAEDELMATVRFQIVLPQETGMVNFRDPDMGFSLDVPALWQYQRSGQRMILFQGVLGTDQYYTTVNIQLLANQVAGGIYTDLNDVYQDYRNQFEASQGRILSYRDEPFHHGGLDLPAQVFVAEYILSGQEFRQWTVIIHSSKNWFHQFSYTAPTDLYDEHLPLAEEIWLSFRLTPIQ